LEEAFVIGGAGIFAAALPDADRFHLTRVHAEVQGDVVLEGFDESQWKEVSRQDYHADENNTYDFSICLLEKL